ncbi:MAG: hypothetical protein WAO95_12410 [Burkholderiales bacterium]
MSDHAISAIRHRSTHEKHSNFNKLLGRCDPYIPVNTMPVETAKSIDEAIAELEKELQRREQVALAKEEKEQPEVSAPVEEALQPDRS